MYLTAQPRESSPYLKNVGWRDTAKLLLLTADEIEGLRKRVHERESMGPMTAPFDPMMIAFGSEP
jgi:hypothetical protein